MPAFWKELWEKSLTLVAEVLAWFAPQKPGPAPPAPPRPIEDVPKFVHPAEVLELLEAHNAFRRQNGKSPMRLNDALCQAAYQHAVWMAQHDNLSHTGDGRGVGERARASGYTWSAIGENIANGYRSVVSVMKGWENSRGHRQNILGQYMDAGFASARTAQGRLYWVADFGTPVYARSAINPPEEAQPVLVCGPFDEWPEDKKPRNLWPAYPILDQLPEELWLDVDMGLGMVWSVRCIPVDASHRPSDLTGVRSWLERHQFDWHGRPAIFFSVDEREDGVDQEGCWSGILIGRDEQGQPCVLFS